MSALVSLIFEATRSQDDAPQDGDDFNNMSGFFRVRASGGLHMQNSPQVAWVLRFGGVLALVACFVARSIPLTRTERMRRGELVDLRLQDDGEGDVDGQVGAVHL